MKGKSKKAKGKIQKMFGSNPSASLRLCGVILLFALTASAQWIRQSVDTTASFRGLSVVNEKVIWASGTGGTVIRTVNGGKTWNVMQVPEAGKLDFRDIEAFDANTAYILSIGNGELSRIYKTEDGGKTWKEQFRNTNEKAFFDAIACWDRDNCIAMSDPVDSKFVLIETKDGGKNWETIDTKNMPSTKDGEAAFAASGTCLITQGKNNAFIVSGGKDARVFKSIDRGKSWSVFDTPIVRGTAGSGIFSISMTDDKNGVIVGGNYETPKDVVRTLATTVDGGATWQLGEQWFGYRSGVAVIGNQILTVGTTGSDSSTISGRIWYVLDRDKNLNAVAGKSTRAIWAVGPNGYIGFLGIKLPYKRNPNLSRTGFPPSIMSVQLSQNEIDLSRADSERMIRVAVSSNVDDFPHKLVFDVTAGRIVGEGPNVLWNLSDVKPGTYTITIGMSEPLEGSTKWAVLGKTNTQVVLIH